MLKENVDVLSADEMDFCYIGKLVMDCSGKEWNFPHLHFLVRKMDNNRYESICLEIEIEATGASVDESVANMIKIVRDLMERIKSKEDFQNLIDATNNHLMDDFWRVYRVNEFALAYGKEDLGNQIDTKIANAVEKLIQKSLEKQIATLLKEALDKNPELKEEIVRLTRPQKAYKDLQITEIEVAA